MQVAAPIGLRSESLVLNPRLHPPGLHREPPLGISGVLGMGSEWRVEKHSLACRVAGFEFV